MKIYMCNCLFHASPFATKYKENFKKFKKRCYSITDCKMWCCFDSDSNTSYVSCLKLVWQELIRRSFKHFMEALEDVYIYSRLHFLIK